jgi:hypothetical protein
MDLASLIEEEASILADTRSGHEEYCTFSENAVGLTEDLMLIANYENTYVNFVTFLWHTHVSLALALLSALRGHQAQTEVMMRQSIEAGVMAAFALGHLGEDWLSSGDVEKLRPHAYSWLESCYPTHSRTIKKIKDRINEDWAHPTMFSAFKTWHFASDHEPGHLSYFDFRDDSWIRLNLWRIGDMALGLTHLIAQVASDRKLWSCPRRVSVRLRELSQTDGRLHALLLSEHPPQPTSSGS